MNWKVIRILFLKDLFLSRRHLFAYLMAGLVAAGMACVPNKTIGFIGFILMITAAIGAGIHLIGTLMLAESAEQTRTFVMSLPVSWLEYSIGKLSVVLTTYLIPWTTMLACAAILTFVVPDSKHGSVVALPAVFLFLLAGFTLQLVVAVVSDSVGWTIGVMVAGNVALNLFFMHFFNHPDVTEVIQGDTVRWPPFVLQVLAIELAVIVVSLIAAAVFQMRRRDLV
jgi:ABC-2 type transport system permease protein